MPKKEVTLKDISQELNLSVQTISKALRGLPGMSERTREKVFQTARQLNYITKDQEQSMFSEKIPVYSNKQKRFVFILHRHDEFNHRILQGIQEKLNEFKHTLETIPLPQEIHITDIDKWLERNGVPHANGIFIAPRIDPLIEQKLLDLPIPRMLINFQSAHTQVDSVIWDVSHAVQQAVFFLKSKGHDRIMFIGSLDSRNRGYKPRMIAFQEAMHEIGEEVHMEEHMISDISDREQWMNEFIKKKDAFQPTAFLNSIELTLPYIYYACIRNGDDIPGDYSLISLETHHTSFFHDITRPLLHLEATGRRASERMLWRIANPHVPYEHIRIMGTINEGQTVKNISTSK